MNEACCLISQDLPKIKIVNTLEYEPGNADEKEEVVGGGVARMKYNIPTSRAFQCRQARQTNRYSASSTPSTTPTKRWNPEASARDTS